MVCRLMKVRLSFLCLLILALSACSGQAGSEEVSGEEGGEHSSSEFSEMWVYDQSRLHVLAELYERSPQSVPAVGNKDEPYYQTRNYEWETNIDYLQDSGILRTSEDGHYVDTELAVFEAGADIPGGTDMVGQAISDTLRESEAAWCGGGYDNANDFARDVSDSAYGSHETEAAYIKDIEERVRCDVGE